IVNDRSFNLNIAEKLQQSFKQGVSIIPKTPLMDAVKNLSKIKQISPIEYPIEIQKDSSYSFNISNSDYRDIYYFTNLNLPYRGDVYLVFKSPQNTFISPTSHRRNKKIQFLKTGVFFIEGFFGSVMTDAMPKGIYDVGILQKNNSQFIYLPTKYQITN
nr:hypothetical protein [Arcicella sp.]